MTRENACETTSAPEAAQERAGVGGAQADAVAAAEAAVRTLYAKYPEWVKDDITDMERALADARADNANSRIHLRRLFDICHNVKGQGGSFGYDLISQIGQSLCDFLRDGKRGTEANLAIVQAHLTAMKTVVDNKIEGDGGEMGRRIVERLEAMSGTAAAP